MPIRTTFLLGIIALGASGLLHAQTPDGGVQTILNKYQSFRPADKDLAIFQLDWVPTLKDAKERAAQEQRPILLIVVTNSYGNLFTGHC
jgi:hypothetical protein